MQTLRQCLAIPATEVELAEPNFARRVDRLASGGAAAASAATSASQAAASGSAFSFLPDDPYFLSSAGWHLRQVAAPLAWATSKGSSNVSFPAAGSAWIPTAAGRPKQLSLTPVF